MTPFATLEELQAQLDWDLSPEEMRDAEGALEEASDLARAYGRYWEDAGDAPRLVHTLVLRSVKRYLKNPSGYTQSRAGDETLGWTDLGENAGAPYYTEAEIKLLNGLSGSRPSGIHSVQVSAWNTKLPQGVGYVPVDPPVPRQKPFPLLTTPEGPW